GEVLLGKRRQHGREIVDAAKGEAERAAGEMRIAAALLERRGFEHEHAGTMFVGRDGGAKRGIAGSDHEHVQPLLRQVREIHGVVTSRFALDPWINARPYPESALDRSNEER